MESVRGNDIGLGDLRNVTNVLCVAIAAVSALIFFKYALEKKKSSYVFPSRKLKLFDIMGCIADILFVSRVKGLPANVYMMQSFMGYHQLFKKEKFYLIWMFYYPIIMVTKAEAVEKLISGSKNLQKNFFYEWLKPWLGTGLLTSYGRKWKTRRKLLTPSFHFDILKDFLPIFNEQSQHLVAILQKDANKPWIDIVKPVTLCTLDIICESTLGVSVGAQKDSESEYVKAVSRVAGVTMERCLHFPYFIDWYFALSKIGIQHKKDLELLHSFTRKAIFEKKQKALSGDVAATNKKRKALMDLLLEQHIQNHSLTEEDIREEVDAFAFAGHDTTSMGISWALYLIGLYKQVQSKIHEELDQIFGDDTERPIAAEDLRDMKYLDCVLKESLRLYPSVPFFARTLEEDVTIDGYTLPKGYSLCILTHSIHRDEAIYPNPEVFDPDRFLPENTINRHPFAYVPFSAGPRNCIGQRFALMEEKVVVANILRNYILESLDTRDTIVLLPELILRAAGPIRIKLKLRSSLPEN